MRLLYQTASPDVAKNKPIMNNVMISGTATNSNALS